MMDRIHPFLTNDTVTPVLLTYTALAVSIIAFVLWRWWAGDLEPHTIAKTPASRSRTLGLQQNAKAGDPPDTTSATESHLKSQ